MAFDTPLLGSPPSEGFSGFGAFGVLVTFLGLGRALGNFALGKVSKSIQTFKNIENRDFCAKHKNHVFRCV